MPGSVLRARGQADYFNSVASMMVEVHDAKRRPPGEGRENYLEKVMPKLGLEERTVRVCQEKG